MMPPVCVFSGVDHPELGLVAGQLLVEVPMLFGGLEHELDKSMQFRPYWRDVPGEQRELVLTAARTVDEEADPRGFAEARGAARRWLDWDAALRAGVDRRYAQFVQAVI